MAAERKTRPGPGVGVRSSRSSPSGARSAPTSVHVMAPLGSAGNVPTTPMSSSPQLTMSLSTPASLTLARHVVASSARVGSPVPSVPWGKNEYGVPSRCRESGRPLRINGPSTQPPALSVEVDSVRQAPPSSSKFWFDVCNVMPEASSNTPIVVVGAGTTLDGGAGASVVPAGTTAC